MPFSVIDLHDSAPLRRIDKGKSWMRGKCRCKIPIPRDGRSGKSAQRLAPQIRLCDRAVRVRGKQIQRAYVVTRIPGLGKVQPKPVVPEATPLFLLDSSAHLAFSLTSVVVIL